jgi:hypothetical protein
MKDRFESLESGEVISIQQDAQVLIGHSTFRVGELNDAIKKQLEGGTEGWNEAKSAWFSPQGIDCEALRFGSNGWQKGRIRLCLEFCPDDAGAAAEQASNHIVSTAIATPPLHVATLNATAEHSNGINGIGANPLKANVETIPAPTTDIHPEPITAAPVEAKTAIDLPLAGIAVGSVVAGGVAVAAMERETATATVPDLTDWQLEPVPTLDVETPAPELADVATPQVNQAVVELEDDRAGSIEPHTEAMDEIAFDFDLNNSDRQGTIVPDGMMELDLTDLDLDRAEHDYLNFETAGTPDSAQELVNLQEGRAENSGILDEVWQEISHQPNWPGIH